ncbi:MAG: hypothetical protein ABR600_02590 [Actinomycetota bacterium]
MRALFRWACRPLAVAASLMLVTPALPAHAGPLGAASPRQAPQAAELMVARARAAIAGGHLADLLIAAGIPEHAGTTHNRAAGLVASIRELSDAVQVAGEIRRPVAAAALVASALDQALPQLLASAPAATDVPTDGCEVVNEAPALCVAGPGDNVITQDYALVVDLGGNDLHANSAGGADPLDNGLPVAVTLDLGGNDRYDTSIPTASGSLVAQGGGLVGGVGFLVDVAGDDSYRAVSGGPNGVARAQGVALHGVGVLADLGGSDTYEVAANGPGSMSALGQGESADGMGILRDAGGDDRYDVSATGTGFFENQFGQVIPPSASALGLGMGQVGHIKEQAVGDGDFAGRGVALFSDGGGADSLAVHADVPDPGQDEMFARVIGWPEARAEGIGYGAEGSHGLALLGDGDTDASVIASARAQRSEVLVQGIGVGIGGGIGAVSDLGGNDTRRLIGDIAIERGADIVTDCECDEPGAGAASHPVTVDGLGAAPDFGTGFLDDAGSGADRYVASASNVVTTAVHDERPDDTGAAAQSYATSGAALLTVQGAGQNFGTGALRDAGGADRYELAAQSVARAIATRGGHAPDAEAHSTAGESFVLGQGGARSSGSGALADLGGSDVYATTSAVAAEADPATSVSGGAPTAAVLASVDAGSVASFVDLDGGAPDQFTATPVQAACTGTRGQGAWVDCGGAGAGFMA